MYRHVLIPTDGSELSRQAIEQGVALAKSINAKVTAITVSAPFHTFAVEPRTVTDTQDQYERRMAEVAASHLDVAKNAARAVGLTCDTVSVQHDHPYVAIIEAAARKGCDLIVMASHGRRGVSAVVLGSETTKVLTHSDVPVLVVRARRIAAAVAA